jgi:hypothetical protein
MTSAHGCSILVDGSGIYGIHKDENKKEISKKKISKKKNDKYNTRLS